MRRKPIIILTLVFTTSFSLLQGWLLVENHACIREVQTVRSSDCCCRLNVVTAVQNRAGITCQDCWLGHTSDFIDVQYVNNARNDGKYLELQAYQTSYCASATLPGCSDPVRLPPTFVLPSLTTNHSPPIFLLDSCLLI